MKWFLAGDLGGTKMAAALVDENGGIAFRKTQVTSAEEGILPVTERFAGLLLEVARQAGNPEIAACSVAVPGLVDPSTGEIRYAANLPGGKDFPLRRRLEAQLGLPVFMDNDLRLHALGESTFGAAARCANFLFVAVGTGVGGALFLDGKLYRGAHSSAGEIGHITIDHSDEAPLCGCGRRGCLETFASGPAIAARFRRQAVEAGLALEPPNPSLKETAAWLGHPGPLGDLTREAIIYGARALGRGLSVAANLLDPERVILGGGVSRIGEFWLAAVRQAIAGRTLNPLEDEVRLAQLSDEAALVGAAVLARQNT